MVPGEPCQMESNVFSSIADSYETLLWSLFSITKVEDTRKNSLLDAQHSVFSYFKIIVFRCSGASLHHSDSGEDSLHHLSHGLHYRPSQHAYRHDVRSLYDSLTVRYISV